MKSLLDTVIRRSCTLVLIILLVMMMKGEFVSSFVPSQRSNSRRTRRHDDASINMVVNDNSVVVSTDQANQLATEWVDAWSNCDIKSIMSHFTDDIEFSSPFVSTIGAGDDDDDGDGEPTTRTGGTLFGRDNVQRYFQAALDKYPEIKFKMIHVYAGVNTVALYYHSINGLLGCEVLFLNSDDGKVFKVLNHYIPSSSSSLNKGDETMMASEEHEKAIQFGTKWVEARNTCDIDSIMACLEDEDEDSIEFTSIHTVGTGNTIKGSETIREYFASIVAQYPEMTYELVNALPGITDDTIALIYKSKSSSNTINTTGDDGSSTSSNDNSGTLYCCEIMFWSNTQQKTKVARIIKHYVKM